jgi:hypothetical protein
LAFSALYLSNRLFGKIKKWPKLKKSQYMLINKKVTKQESIFATMFLFDYIRNIQTIHKTKKKSLKRKKSFTDVLINKINKLFSINENDENELIFEDTTKGRLRGFQRIKNYNQDKFISFSSIDDNNYTLELSFELRNVKQTSINIFSGILIRV